MTRALALLAIICALPLQAQAPGTIEVRRGDKIVASNRADSAKADLRVLFVGNSLTYWNEMPSVFEWVAESRGRRPRTRFSGGSGMSLRQHWEQGRAHKAIAEGPWDFVVLQAQSR
jgi:hypothetical protein